MGSRPRRESEIRSPFDGGNRIDVSRDNQPPSRIFGCQKVVALIKYRPSARTTPGRRGAKVPRVAACTYINYD